MTVVTTHLRNAMRLHFQKVQWSPRVQSILRFRAAGVIVSHSLEAAAETSRPHKTLKYAVFAALAEVRTSEITWFCRHERSYKTCIEKIAA